MRSSKHGIVKRSTHWFVDRFGLDKITDFAISRRISKAPWYYGEGAPLLLILGVLVGNSGYMKQQLQITALYWNLSAGIKLVMYGTQHISSYLFERQMCLIGCS